MKKNVEGLTNQKKKVTVDDIDQAHLDVLFVRAFVEMLYNIDGNKTLDELRSGTVSAMCSEALRRIEKLKAFIDSVPGNALPADILKMKAKAAA